MTDLTALRAIVDGLLQQTETAMTTHDFDLFEAAILLPYFVETLDGTTIVRTRDDLHEMFKHNLAFYKWKGIRHIVRHCTTATLRDPETMASLYHSRLLDSRQILVGKPYLTFSLIRKVGKVWRVASSQYASADTEHGRALLGQAWPTASSR